MPKSSNSRINSTLTTVRTSRCLMPWHLIAALLLLPGAAHSQPGSGDFHVDPASGADTNPGTIELPFKSLARAVQAARAGHVVLLRGGVYRETLTPSFSGEPDNPITFAGYPGEEAIISGFDSVTGWEAGANGVFHAPVPTAPLHHVLIDGESAIEARWPNHSSWEVLRSPYGTVDTTSNSGAVAAGRDTVTDAGLPTGMPADWLDGAKIAYKDWFRAWSSGIKTVTAFNPASKSITMDGMIQYSDAGRYLTDSDAFRYELYGSRGLIDADREWAYVSNAGLLYLKTPGGKHAADFLIETPVRTATVNLNWRSHIRVENITLVGGSIQSNERTSRCIINNIRMRYATGESRLYGIANEISDSEIVDSLNGIISITGTRHRFVNNRVRENAGRGLRLLYLKGSEHLVAYNTFSRSFQAIIGMSTTWRCQIVHNEFNEASLRVKDMGALYTVFNGGLSEIAYNRFLGDYRDIPHTYGVYLDGGASHYQVHHNVSFMNLLNMQKNGVLNFNNTIYRWKDYGDGPFSPLNRISDQQRVDSDLAGSMWLNNLYAYDYDPVPGQPRGYYLDQAAGIAGQVFNDGSGLDLAALENPGAYDFTLKAGSPAIDAGVAIEGITDGYSGAAPDLGAYESGQPAWKAGQDLVNKPVIEYDFPNNRRPCRYINLLVRGGFDDYENSTSFAPWLVVSGSANLQYQGWGWPPQDLAYLPYYSLQVGGGTSEVTQLVADVPGSRSYGFTVMVRATSSSQAFEIGVRLADGSIVRASRTNLPVAPSTWTRMHVGFTLPPGNHSITAFLRKSSNDAGTAYFDEAILAEAFTEVVELSGPAGSISISATEDTTIQENSTADLSYKTDLLLRENSSTEYRPFFKFDLSSLTGRSIEQAVLQLWGLGEDRLWKFSLKQVNTDWSGSTINWANQPPLGSTVASFQLQGSNQGVTPLAMSVDLTAYIRTRLASDGIANLAIDDEDNSGKLFEFTSTDLASLTPPHPLATPRLDIVFSTPEMPGNISASASLSPKQVRLAWTGSVNSLSYAIHRADSASGPFHFVGSTANPEFTDPEVSAGKRYHYRINGVNESGTGPFAEIEPVTVPVHTYESWAEEAGLIKGMNSDPFVDPDRDGILNLFEFVLDGHPLVSDRSILPTARIINGEYTNSFSRTDASEAGVAQVFEYSYDLSNWTAIPIGPIGSSYPGAQVAISENMADADMIRITLSAGSAESIFSRLTLRQY